MRTRAFICGLLLLATLSLVEAKPRPRPSEVAPPSEEKVKKPIDVTKVPKNIKASWTQAWIDKATKTTDANIHEIAMLSDKNFKEMVSDLLKEDKDPLAVTALSLLMLRGYYIQPNLLNEGKKTENWVNQVVQEEIQSILGSKKKTPAEKEAVLVRLAADSYRTAYMPLVLAALNNLSGTEIDHRQFARYCTTFTEIPLKLLAELESKYFTIGRSAATLKTTSKDLLVRIQNAHACMELSVGDVYYERVRAYLAAYAEKLYPGQLVTSQIDYLGVGSNIITDNEILGRRIAQAYTEKYAPSTVFVVREGQIEATTATLSANYDRMADNHNLSLYLKKLAPKVMPINANQDLVERSRQLAINLCESIGDGDRRFCANRQRIHGGPSQFEVEETRRFIKIYQDEGATQKATTAQALLNTLETLYGGGNQGQNLMASVNTLLNESPGLMLKKHYKKFEKDYSSFQSGSGNLSQGKPEWLDLLTTADSLVRDSEKKASSVDLKFSNLLQNESFASATQIVGALNPGLYSGQGPEEQKKTRLILSSLLKGIYAEGLIEKDRLEEGLKVIAGKTLTDDAIKTLIEKVTAEAIAKINTDLKSGQDFMSQFDETATHMIENFQRSSLLQPLSKLKQKLSGLKAFEAYMNGTVCGKVRIIDDISDIEGVPTGIGDILVFMGVEVPAHLGVFGALITADEQSALSHVDLKAKNRGSPGAYAGDAAEKFKGLDAQNVKLEVTSTGLKVVKMDVPFEQPKNIRPPITPEINLKVNTIQDLDEKTLQTPDLVKAIGTKAFNYGHLDVLFKDATVQAGAAIPFSYYTEFMKGTGLQGQIDAIVADPRMKGNDSVYRADKLKSLQEKIMKAKIDATVLKGIQADLQKRFGTATRVKFRSSSNSEDLPGFNGAGLYDSYGANLDNLKDIEKNLKMTWASVWNDRAFAEREVFNITHAAVAMGVLVHASYRGETANGVALTTDSKLTVVAQHGETSITNPEPDKATGEIPRPDEVTIDMSKPKPEVTYTKHTTMKGGAPSIDEARMEELGTKLKMLQDYFKTKVYKTNDPNFTMDVEFKTVNGKDGKPIIVIKQARPFTANK